MFPPLKFRSTKTGNKTVSMFSSFASNSVLRIAFCQTHHSQGFLCTGCFEKYFLCPCRFTVSKNIGHFRKRNRAPVILPPRDFFFSVFISFLMKKVNFFHVPVSYTHCTSHIHCTLHIAHCTLHTTTSHLHYRSNQEHTFEADAPL